MQCPSCNAFIFLFAISIVCTTITSTLSEISSFHNGCHALAWTQTMPANNSHRKKLLILSYQKSDWSLGCYLSCHATIWRCFVYYSRQINSCCKVSTAKLRLWSHLKFDRGFPSFNTLLDVMSNESRRPQTFSTKKVVWCKMAILLYHFAWIVSYIMKTSSPSLYECVHVFLH